MSRLSEVGEREGWRCWLCDQPVDPEMSVNDARGPSVDTVLTKAKAKASGQSLERLAHRGCNTNKGATAPVVPWPDHLFVIDPAPIVATVDHLTRKRGKAVMARCIDRSDADAAAHWLADRLTRLAPDTPMRATVDPGGGQFLVVLHSS